MDAKALLPMKAEGLTSRAMESWLSGERSRRIMVVPFGGPLPGGKAGLDIDGEEFDADTDIYGPYPALRSSPDRLVDWHHDNDRRVPASVHSMKGAIIGKIILDDGPSVLTGDDGADYEGVAADFWANAGEQRLALIRALSRRGATIYGSSQALYKKATGSHIDEWPIYRHTLSTSPQNTYAVVPTLKAILTADGFHIDEIGWPATKAALLGFGDLPGDLRETLAAMPGDPAASKAGRELSARNYAQLRELLDSLTATVEAMVEKYRAGEN